MWVYQAWAFQPTLPVRGVTRDVESGQHTVQISTHTPRAGSDEFVSEVLDNFSISTHTPRAGSDSERQQRPACAG